MPSKSPAQARLFAAVAHNPAFAAKVGIPQSVGRDFNQADAGTGILSRAAGGAVEGDRRARGRSDMEAYASGGLTADDRKALPSGDFLGPGRSFPVPDKKHARLAVSGATRSERAGNISASEAASIKRRARAKLG